MPNLLTARHLLACSARFMFWLWTGCLVINCASGQAQQRTQTAGSAATRKATRPVLPDRVQAILDDLQDVPPELHADALLLLVESGEKLDRPTKISFVKEAAEEAQQASASVRMRSGVLILGHDTAEELDERDDERSLDRMSLLSRSVTDMAALDPAEALKLAASMLLPEMPPVGCSNALTYSPAPYYFALQVVSQRWNPTPGRSKDARVDLLAPAMSRIETHMQVPPALKLLSAPGFSVQEREVLTSTFLDALAQVSGDPRGFTAEMLKAPPTDVAKLYQMLEASDPGSGLGLLKGFRAYLVSNYNAGGCAELWDSMKIVGWEKGSVKVRVQDARDDHSLPAPVNQFNQDFAKALTNVGFGPIQFSEIHGTNPGDKATVHEYQTDGLEAMWDAERQLRFDPQGENQTDAVRTSAAWRAEATDYLDSVDDWQGDPSDPLETAHEKSELYSALIDLAPQQDLRWLAISKDISMIENCGLENGNPSAWMTLMLEIQQKIRYNGPAHAKQITTPGFVTRLIQSSSASVRLIGLLYALGIDPFSSGPLPK
jgi:hypothetical protein